MYQVSFLAATATNPSGFFGAIKGVALSWLNPLIDVFLIPVGVLICAVFLVMNVVKCVTDYNEGHGDQMKGKIMYIVLIIIVVALLLSKELWWGFVFAG